MENTKKINPDKIIAWNNTNKITAKTIKYIYKDILKRNYTTDEYEKHFQDIQLIVAKILGCYK